MDSDPNPHPRVATREEFLAAMRVYRRAHPEAETIGQALARDPALRARFERYHRILLGEIDPARPSASLATLLALASPRFPDARRLFVARRLARRLGRPIHAGKWPGPVQGGGPQSGGQPDSGS